MEEKCRNEIGSSFIIKYIMWFYNEIFQILQSRIDKLKFFFYNHDTVLQENSNTNVAKKRTSTGWNLPERRSPSCKGL